MGEVSDKVQAVLVRALVHLVFTVPIVFGLVIFKGREPVLYIWCPLEIGSSLHRALSSKGIG